MAASRMRALALALLWLALSSRAYVRRDRIKASAGPHPRGPFCTLANLTAALAPGSAELDQYVAGVYGAEPDEALRASRNAWFSHQLQTAVEVIWLRLLPPALRKSCSWPAHPKAAGDVYWTHGFPTQPDHTVWIYRHPTPLPCQKVNVTAEDVGDGRPLAAMHDASASYVEVTHRYWDLWMEDSAYWMFRAVGSGLWYRQGRTMLTPSMTTAARMTASMGPAHSAQEVFQNIARLAHKRRYQTIAWSNCEKYSPAARVELAGYFPNAQLKQSAAFFNQTCPKLFSGGWPAGSTACRCGWSWNMPTRRTPTAHLLCRNTFNVSVYAGEEGARPTKGNLEAAAQAARLARRLRSGEEQRAGWQHALGGDGRADGA